MVLSTYNAELREMRSLTRMEWLGGCQTPGLFSQGMGTEIETRDQGNMSKAGQPSSPPSEHYECRGQYA